MIENKKSYIAAALKFNQTRVVVVYWIDHELNGVLICYSFKSLSG